MPNGLLVKPEMVDALWKAGIEPRLIAGRGR